MVERYVGSVMGMVGFMVVVVFLWFWGSVVSDIVYLMIVGVL